MIVRLLTLPFRYGFSKLKRAIGKLDIIQIESLYAFGNERKVYIKARVVEAYKQSVPTERKSAPKNMLAAVRRYSGSSVSDVEVLARLGDSEIKMVSDEEGILEGKFKTPPASKNELVSFTFIENGDLSYQQKEVLFPVSRYSSEHPVGIISDIDDTILVSKATQLGEKLWLSISKNAYTRRPFPGISKFYKGLTNYGENPVFYVSSSDWNLNELIKDFLEYRHIPKGPLLLQDLHVNLRNIWKSGGGSHVHKKEKIILLFKLYRSMKFILVGDSGQHDPELYAEAIEEFPDKVIAVYIRIIRPMDSERRQLLDRFKDKVAIAYVKNTDEAINHALENGFIKPDII
ncbi:phosphatase domain-containing protein [Litoribacter populi]|uniref:phosphatase domain-containing protein n=1 Tax=Litoribacter populi TaxID=2598460 RepID=UPI00117CB7E9|nr:phosphatase domain-containing protein [Litoribacter populi]